MKSVALYDLDNTLYDGFSFFGLLEDQANRGLLRSAVVHDVSSVMRQHKDGKIPYEDAIARMLDVHAIGLTMEPYEPIMRASRNFYKKSPDFHEFVRPLVKRLRPTHDQILVTGEGQFAAQAVKDILGLTDYCSSRYRTTHDYGSDESVKVFTGWMESTLARREEKRAAVTTMLGERSLDGSLAFGDSVGDIEMLELVEHQICVDPDDGLRQHANAHDWAVVTPDQVLKTVDQILGA